MLTVACVWVNGHLPYKVEYVERLHAMARRWISRPFTFVCLTDQPHLVPAGVTAIEIPNPNPLKGWWSKVELFRAGRFTGRVLYLDLDSLIVDPLDVVIDYPAAFALAPHAGTFNGKGGLHVVKAFNSSVMVWDAGTQDYLHTDWTPAVAAMLWGDQDWIGTMAHTAKAMPLEWFPRLSESMIDATSATGKKWIWNGPPSGAKVVLCKKPKNSIAAAMVPEFAEAWG
jgi:hypothetical protein